MEAVIQDKSLPHQPQLVFATGPRKCLNGDTVKHADVVVTCNCHRIGQGNNFRSYIAPAPTLDVLWEPWNNPKWHEDRETFKPYLKEAR